MSPATMERAMAAMPQRCGAIPRKAVAMNDTQTPGTGEERLRRIEARIVVAPPVWSGDEQVRTIQERMAYHHTPGLSVAVINGGHIEWTRGYGVLRSEER